MAVWIAPLITAVGELFRSWVNAKKAKHEAEIKFQEKMGEIEATWDLIALRQAQFSWKDEFITLIVFFPLIMAWFPEWREDVLSWVEFVSNLPFWYQILIFGITAASFGLRWFFKQQDFKIGKGGNTDG
jgi:hypothetical protein